mmetsp:Transcript_31572/g.66115  ORF Transcript_31572/g.66115 Transcript_31572/m.66115 type:complete len:368 (+) Transcript_31572:1622-2725(+)
MSLLSENTPIALDARVTGVIAKISPIRFLPAADRAIRKNAIRLRQARSEHAVRPVAIRTTLLRGPGQRPGEGAGAGALRAIEPLSRIAIGNGTEGLPRVQTSRHRLGHDLAGFVHPRLLGTARRCSFPRRRRAVAGGASSEYGTTLSDGKVTAIAGAADVAVVADFAAAFVPAIVFVIRLGGGELEGRSSSFGCTRPTKGSLVPAGTVSATDGKAHGVGIRRIHRGIYRPDSISISSSSSRRHGIPPCIVRSSCNIEVPSSLRPLLRHRHRRKYSLTIQQPLRRAPPHSVEITTITTITTTTPTTSPTIKYHHSDTIPSTSVEPSPTIPVQVIPMRAAPCSPVSPASFITTRRMHVHLPRLVCFLPI